MFESTEWVLEEPDVNDNTKYDLVFPSIVRPKHLTPHSVCLSEIYGNSLAKQFLVYSM